MKVPSTLKIPEWCISSAWKNYYAPPVAGVSLGNSHLADGYVTFMAKQKNGNRDAPTEAEKVSIMVQAKDYRADLSDLEVSKLNDRAEFCYDPCLDRQYGTKRLLVVAGSDDVVFATSTGTVKRDFVSFRVDRLRAFDELMAGLEGNRKKARTSEEGHSRYFSSGGIVTGIGSEEFQGIVEEEKKAADATTAM